jgi:carboxypeptidase family protein/outer membrane beta-barrel protein/TonB-dependent receptor-like protein
MSRLRVASALSLVLLAFLATAAAGQDKGSVSGKVIDKKTGHAIPFATVTVLGAQRGGLTDSEGRYMISGVPADTFEVRVQFLGFAPSSKPGVLVTAGRTTVANFELSEIVVREEKVFEVKAERRLVEVKQGTTIRSVNAGEIRNLPVQTIGDVLQQQAGINTDADQIHVRGGRSDETIFVVNGVTNRDLVTGSSTAGQLNARSVAEVNVATGAYDVRYGNALSGVVEITLKEGGQDLSGGITTSAGRYGGRGMQLVLGGPDPVVGRMARVLGVPGTFASILDVSGSLFETRYRYLDGRDGGILPSTFGPVFEPSPYRRLHSGYEDSFFGKRFTYGNFFTPAADNRWALRYGLTWKPGSQDKLNLNFSKRIAIDQGFSRSFVDARGNIGDPAYKWIWAHRIDHAPTIFEDNVQTSLEWRRTLSTTGYTRVQVARYFFAQHQDVMGKRFRYWDEAEGVWKTDYEEPQDRALFDSTDVRAFDFFNDSGDDDTYEDRRTTSYGIQASLTQRLRRHHELEFGIDHDFQSVQFVHIEKPWIFDPDGLGESHDIWRVHPWVGDLYVRDRLDYEGFTANVGLRCDYWFLGREAERAVANPKNAFITPERRAEFYDGTGSFFGRRVKLKFSPRVIVAHPISEHSSFFFNYGQFTQNPSYKYVYSRLVSVSSESYQLVGNPNLNPQVSVNYEVGAKHQFLPKAAANVTFFVKDIYDYPKATLFSRGEAAVGEIPTPIFFYLNGSFARSRGFEIEIEKRRSRNWSGKVTYTFQQIKGKDSDPFEQKVLQENGGNAAETRLSETFVDWNRPHKLAVNFDLRFNEEAPRSWLANTGLNLFVHGLTGRAYTPLDSVANALGDANSGNAPFQITTDLKLNRSITVAGRKLDLSVAGTNIFNNYIINRVDPITGRGRVFGEGSYDPSIPELQVTRRTVEQFVNDPSNYGPGSQWRLQLDYDF